MRHLNRHLFIVSLLFTALVGDAAQLGSAKGSAAFGRPLDLKVQVRLDTPTEEAANCFSAEVFQADNKFDVGRVRLDVTPAPNGLDATVRIRSVTAVNEPWAKVILRSNCGSKVSRQYDFLTDFGTESSASNMLAEVAPTQPSSNTENAATSASAAAKSGSVVTRNGAVDAPDSGWRVKRSQVTAKKSQQTLDSQIAQATLIQKKAKSMTPTHSIAATGDKKATDMPAQAAGQARLKMETFELTDEHQVLLKLSTALVAPTGMRTPEEIQALAQATAVWRAINGMPVEVKTVDASALQAPATTATVAATVATAPMNQKLASKSGFSNLMVYALIGLLALTLACIAWLWLRVRKASRAGYGWLNDSGEDERIDHESNQLTSSAFHVTKMESVFEKYTEVPFAQNDRPEIEAETDTGMRAEIKEATKQSAAKAAAEEILLEEVEVEVKQTPTANATSAEADTETPFVPQSPQPAHFDDPRFDEQVLHTKKKNKDAAHEQPITSSAELMALILADTPPKLRSVSTPAPALDEKTKAAKVAIAISSKDDIKGNLIDFDVFAEPEPFNKPTRFVR